MKTIKTFLLTTLLCLFISTAVYATLTDYGNGLIYDSEQNITWLQDANYVKTWATQDWVNDRVGDVVAGHTLTNIDFQGIKYEYSLGYLSWWGATAFVNDLDYGGFTDWRLPSTPGTSTGVLEGEMGHLYGDGITFSNPDPFINLVSYSYWTGKEEPSSYTWAFNFNSGGQSWVHKSNTSFVLAVHDGDIGNNGPAPIPEPCTLLLLGSGLASLGLYRKRIKR